MNSTNKNTNKNFAAQHLAFLLQQVQHAQQQIQQQWDPLSSFELEAEVTILENSIAETITNEVINNLNMQSTLYRELSRQTESIFESSMTTLQRNQEFEDTKQELLLQQLTRLQELLLEATKANKPTKTKKSLLRRVWNIFH